MLDPQRIRMKANRISVFSSAICPPLAKVVFRRTEASDKSLAGSMVRPNGVLIEALKKLIHQLLPLGTIELRPA